MTKCLEEALSSLANDDRPYAIVDPSGEYPITTGISSSGRNVTKSSTIRFVWH